jgi:hypothetical protein
MCIDLIKITYPEAWSVTISNWTATTMGLAWVENGATEF